MSKYGLEKDVSRFFKIKIENQRKKLKMGLLQWPICDINKYYHLGYCGVYRINK